MKRFALVMVSVLLCLSMVACSAEPDDDKAKATKATKTTTVTSDVAEESVRTTTVSAEKKTTTSTAKQTTKVTGGKGTTAGKTTATTGQTTTATTGCITTTTGAAEDNQVFHTFMFAADEAAGLQIALTQGSAGTFSPVKEEAETAQKKDWWDAWVDLSDHTYGAEKVVFNPAALLLADGKITEGLLQYPVYGADGRVSGLQKAVTAVYNGKDFAPSDRYGLRAIGVPAASYFATYGLVVDLAFRSQQEGTLTLEEDSLFYYETEEYGRAAEFLRLVFFDTETGEILARAKPDVDHTKTEKKSIAAPLRFIDEGDVFVSNVSIADLTAGETHRISVLVYLDGEKVTNADVIAGVDSVWRGLSLRFSAISE